MAWILKATKIVKKLLPDLEIVFWHKAVLKLPVKHDYCVKLCKIASVINDLWLFLYISCRSLSCQRITLHKNLFFSYVLNSAFTIINLITVVNNPKVVQRSPVSTPHLHNTASIPAIFNNYVGKKIQKISLSSCARHFVSGLCLASKDIFVFQESHNI